MSTAQGTRPWVRKGRIDPVPYVEKAFTSHSFGGVLKSPFDLARAHGGKRKGKDSPPLPVYLQVQAPRRRTSKRRMLDKLINPKPTYLKIGMFKVAKAT